MASKKKSRPVATFKYPLTVEVHQPAFKLLNSLRFLDMNALSKAARAEVAIGEVDGGCCQHTLYATIRKGNVVGVRAEECPKEGRRAPSHDHKNLVARAMKRVRAKRRSRIRLPIPASRFFGRPELMQMIVVGTLVCIRVCLLNTCITCCQRTDLPDADIVCGRINIDTTVLD